MCCRYSILRLLRGNIVIILMPWLHQVGIGILNIVVINLINFKCFCVYVLMYVNWFLTIFNILKYLYKI